MKVAMISNWHVHAGDYARQIKVLPQCEIVAVWNEDAESGKKWADELGAKFIEDYDALLADEAIEGVVINAPTNRHAELILKAAHARKHIFTEKVLALTTQECIQIKEVVEQNGLKFSIGFVHQCKADLLFAKQMCESGALGDITYARVRNAHNGSTANWLPAHFYNKEQCGGGAMIDLGAHTIYLLEWLVGQPQNVAAILTHVTGRPVEDNAVAILEFASGAVGVAETSFVSVYTPITIEISGTKGSMLINDKVTYANEETKGNWVQVEELPAPLPNPLVQWVEAVTENKPISISMNQAVSLTRTMEGIYKSQRSGQKVTL